MQDSIEYLPSAKGFTLRVGPVGWFAQMGKLIGAALLLYLAWIITRQYFQGNSIVHGQSVQWNMCMFLPLWAGFVSVSLWAIQSAYRTVLFAADAHTLEITAAGPIHRWTRQYPRGDVRAIAVTNGKVATNHQAQKQLSICLANESRPVCLLTGRDVEDVRRVATYLHEALNPAENRMTMTVRDADMNTSLFRWICGCCVGVSILVLVFFGQAAAGITMFVLIPVGLAIHIWNTRRMRCPGCGAWLRVDSMSDEGNSQYTCVNCWTVWKSPFQAGGPGN